MKKMYSTPRILFEDFQLSQSIAAGCEFKSNHVWEVCPLTIEDGSVIFSNSDCEYPPAPGMDDRICYDVPGDDYKVYTS